MRQREILNAAKEQAGMTQKEFAKYFGIPLRTVEGWYTEKREIPDYLLRLMLYRLEVAHKVSNLMQYVPFPDEKQMPIDNQKFIGGERMGDQYDKKDNMVLTVVCNRALYSTDCLCKNKMETICHF